MPIARRRTGAERSQSDLLNNPGDTGPRALPSDAHRMPTPGRIALTRGWRIFGCKPQPDAADAAKPPGHENGWMDCPVPGDVNAALLKHGHIPDPRFNTNARQAYWVTGREWWYRLNFDVARRFSAAHLVFECVNGPADVWLNGRFLGELRNSFRPFRLDVTAVLRRRRNRLMLRFKSIDRLLGPRPNEVSGWDPRPAFLRMPQFSFGWDWALPLPGVGLGGPVRLELDCARRFTDFSVKTHASGRVDFDFEVSPEAKASGYRIELAVSGHGCRLRRVLERNVHRSYVSVDVPNPRLWFPAGYGDQPLYRYRAALRVKGRTVDVRAGRFGLREVRIVEKPFADKAGPGMAFTIEVNGVSVFCKGANWVPLEMWPATAATEAYDFYLRRAREANFNMLRVWGGGLYEPDHFYERCDRLGIMVWQDFMFASQPYPLPLLRDEILAEAGCQVGRLRNHPCVVLWCGCNEDVHSWEFRSEADPRPGQRLIVGKGRWRVDRTRQDPELYTLLRGVVARRGLDTPYVESSPHSRDDFGNMPNSGNCHISSWKYALFQTGGHPERFREHFEQTCSFNSEFCVQGPCSVKTFKRFFPPENFWPPNEDWIFHLQRGHARIPHHEQTLLIAGGLFGNIGSLQQYVKYGQAAHAELVRAEFESARRDRPNCGGTMVWQYNDCWPTANWSIIDYYRSPKPAYYAAARACAPLLPVVFERGGRIEFFFANDSLRPVSATLTWGRESLDGKCLWARRRSLRIPPNCVVQFDSMPRGDWRRLGDYLFIDAGADGGPLDRVTYFPGLWKNVAWPEDPRMSVELLSRAARSGRHTMTLRIRTEEYSRFCHIRLRREVPGTEFSDNYFDLSAGAERTVQITSPGTLRLDDLALGHWNTDWE